MASRLIELTLGESPSSSAIVGQSFNNDSSKDGKRNSFRGMMKTSNPREKKRVPPKYLHPNVHNYRSNQIHRLGDKIIVGEYCNHGVIVPRNRFGIVFSRLYNCAPLVSLIRGEEEHISFLHTWAIPNDSDVVDKQVKHWMKTVSRFGEVSETIFAPRQNRGGADTKYQTAIDHIREASQTTVLFNRDLGQIRGIANNEGVYFRGCGYHLWEH